jgi:mRNA interferase MazF
MSNPQRGEVWLADFGYAAKTRPALVLSIPALDEDRALATMVMHTTSTRGSRFEVNVAVKFLRPGAFECQNLTTISHSQLIRKLGMLTAEQMQPIEDTVRQWLGL